MVLNVRMDYSGESVGKGNIPLFCLQSWTSSAEKVLKAAKILFYLSKVKVNGFTPWQGDRPNGSRSKKELLILRLKKGQDLGGH